VQFHRIVSARHIAHPYLDLLFQLGAHLHQTSAPDEGGVLSVGLGASGQEAKTISLSGITQSWLHGLVPLNYWQGPKRRVSGGGAGSGNQGVVHFWSTSEHTTAERTPDSHGSNPLISHHFATATSAIIPGGRSRKPLCPQGHRGFESLPLRHIKRPRSGPFYMAAREAVDGPLFGTEPPQAGERQR
jgi:hypothetical protein